MVVEMNIERGSELGSVLMRIDSSKLEEVLTILMKSEEVTFISVK